MQWFHVLANPANNGLTVSNISPVATTIDERSGYYHFTAKSDADRVFIGHSEPSEHFIKITFEKQKLLHEDRTELSDRGKMKNAGGE
jgi:hypothetical protein